MIYRRNEKENYTALDYRWKLKYEIIMEGLKW